MWQAWEKRILSLFLLKPKRLAIFEACLIGLVSGLAGVILKLGVGKLGSLRIAASLILPPWLILPLLGMLGGWLTGWLVQRLAIETAGSGIPHVKTVLAGVGKNLNLRIAIVKLFTSILALGSGLTLGRQGPTVQIGASLAASIGNLFPTSPEYRQQLIAAGAAAGLAAGFNAPIAGVLFVIEELLQDFSNFTLGSAIIAAFIGAVVSRLLGGDSLNLGNLDPINSQISFTIKEIPFYIILGLLAGGFGALFSRSIIASLKFQKSVLKLTLPARIALAGLISGLIVANLPAEFRNHTGFRDFLLTGDVNMQIVAIAFLVHFGLTVLAAGSSAPGGLFAPSLILGCALGQIVGLWEYHWLQWGEPITYAFTGMGAFFCAVSRAPITSVIIVFEITQQFHLVLPLMISSVVAYLLAEKLVEKSLYDQILLFSGIDLSKPKKQEDSFINLQASAVMTSKVETLDSQLTLADVKQIFAKSQHRGYPVITDAKLVGMITLTDLEKIRQLNMTNDTHLIDFMTPQPVTANTDDSLNQVLFLLSKYKLSHLPVLEGKKLVGIITRSDIIKAESEQLLGNKSELSLPATPSYVVYQTRSPQIGQGRLLVLVSNPQTASALLHLAANIAKSRNYELECLQVILIPHQNSPKETAVDTRIGRRMLKKAERIGRQWHIPVHTQIKVAHDLTDAILETIKEKHINLLLMGWRGKKLSTTNIFGNVIDILMKQAPCQIIVVKWSINFNYNLALNGSIDHDNYAWQGDRWLVPVRSGGEMSAGVSLLKDLIPTEAKPEITLCQVLLPNSLIDHQSITQTANFLQQYLETTVIPLTVCSSSVINAITDIAMNNQCDVIILGASKDGFLKQAIHGNIPEAIARNCYNSTVILVRN
ncbi:MAG: chloride channel protein [Microcoleaceae cyanobacterium]